ncbi:MAG: glycoside hydrolase family 2 protein [Pseudoxanthomonas sp.]
MPLHSPTLRRTPLGALLALALAVPGWAAAPRVQSLNDGWQVRLAPGQHDQARAHPKAASWLQAKVPGAVQSDLIKAGLVADPFVGENEAKIQWVGLSDWQYRSAFQVDAATLAREHLELVFDGLDTFAEVTLNGKPVLKADNMFRSWRVDAKPLLKRGENVLEVTFRSPVEVMRPWLAKQPYGLPGAYDDAFGNEPEGRNSSIHVRKAPYQFSWDWGPRIINAGIWQDVQLVAWDAARVDDLYIDQQRVDADAAQLQAQFTVEGGITGPVDIALQVLDPDGKEIAKLNQQQVIDPGRNQIAMPVRIAKPRRWYPAGYGAQDRYTFIATVRDANGDTQQIKRVTGLRTVEIRREKDQWGRGMAFVINGIPVFAKGANLIPLDSFPNNVTEVEMRRTLTDARDANMNMLRMWGGGHYQDGRFYDIADELGIMIWQDFMFGGAVTPYDVDFRENTRQEAIEQVIRLRNHPSIVIWCGNNEVQTGWENWSSTEAFRKSIDPKEVVRLDMGMANLFGTVLREAVSQHSPSTPYWASSPGTDYDAGADLTDDGDMHYWAVWGGAAHPVTQYLNVTPRFMSEYGLQSMPEMRTIRAFAGEGELSLDHPAVKSHQKWDKGRGNARQLLYIRREFGEPKDFESFVYLSQLMQAEGIEIAASHHRASMPRTMGTLYWQLNDVWPVVSWSSVDYYGRWKALQYRARHFFAPQAVMALRKPEGSTAVNLVSERTTPLNARLRTRLIDVEGKTLSTREDKVTLKPLTSTPVNTYSDEQLLGKADPKRTVAVFDLIDGDKTISRAVVYFDAAKHLALPQPQIDAQLAAEGDGYTLTLSSPVLAREVWVSFGSLDAKLSDNAFTLLPGEPMTLHLTSKASLEALRAALQLRDVASTMAGAPAEPAESL